MTTSLRPATAEVPRRSKRRTAAAPQAGEGVLTHNGVPRTTWYRAVPRLATWYRPYVAGLTLLDLCAVVLASYTAISTFEQANVGFRQHSPLWFLILAYVLLPIGWLFILWSHGAYDRRHLGIGAEEYKRVFRAFVTATATVSFLAFALKIDLSRLSVGTVLVGSLVYTLLARWFARWVLTAVRKRGRAAHRVLLVGTLAETTDVCAAVSRVPGAGLLPIGIHLTERFPAGKTPEGPVPVYTEGDVIARVREIGADTIAVCGSARTDGGELRRLAWQLEGTGVDLVVAPQLTDIAGPRVHVRPVEGLPLLHVEEPKLSGFAWLFKNVMDRALAAVLLVVLSPLFLVISLAIRMGDHGKAFFQQSRVGREGKVFKVIKFRTMYPDAEERLAQLVSLNETDGLLFKIKDDPRITPVGRFLRKTSLDELPQLINVIRGEMSLVGPRPLPADDGDFLGDVRRRLLVKPGMTGLWQVSGRSELSWDDAVRLDLYYVDNWSLAFDMVILWRTIGVVLGRRGAY